MVMEDRIKYPLEQRLREHIVGQEGPISVVGSGEHNTFTEWLSAFHHMEDCFYSCAWSIFKPLLYFIDFETKFHQFNDWFCTLD